MKYLIALAVLYLAYNVTAIERDGKFLSMFNIVRFPNDACDGGSRNGTCYTKEECSDKGGTEDGSCAQGYGVCCTFIVNCGASVSENNTFFESEGEEKSHCSIQVCKASSSIVQLRLDFVDFAITGPDTSTTSIAFTTAGNIATAAGQTSNLASRCTTDIFSVSNPGGPSPPQICGNNIDQHMYVDMGSDCTDLTFQLGSASVSPKWKIRVTQYEVTYDNLAPFGCTQYFWAQDSDSDGKGTITSYNYNSGSGHHLADQNQVICIRREDDKTRICYWTAAATDISISGLQASAANAVASAHCGGYKDDGSGAVRDAIIIKSLTNKVTAGSVSYSNICGMMGISAKAVAGAGNAVAATVCSKANPFTVTFTSDSWELHATDMEEATANVVGNTGFKISYEQDTG